MINPWMHFNNIYLTMELLTLQIEPMYLKTLGMQLRLLQIKLDQISNLQVSLMLFIIGSHLLLENKDLWE